MSKARLPAVMEAINGWLILELCPFVVHAHTECREEMGPRLTRRRVRRTMGRATPLEHGVGVVSATASFECAGFRTATR